MSDSKTIIKRPVYKSVPMVCAWCGKVYKIALWDMDERETQKSHGICEECHKAFFEKYGRKDASSPKAQNACVDEHAY